MDGDELHLESGCTRGCTDRTLLIAALAVSWLLLLFWPLPLVIEILIGLALVSRKYPRINVLFCFSSTTIVIACTILLTVFGYFTGTAKYITLATNQPDAIGAFSPRYRCDNWWFPGDIGMGWMWLVSIPNTLTIRTCCALFGPVKHTYHGPLPDKGEVIAWANSKSCQQIPLTQFTSGNFIVAGKSIHIPSSVVNAVEKRRKCPDPDLATDIIMTDENVIYVELYKDKCLVSITPTETADWMDYPKKFWIISLVDTSTGRLITQEIYSNALAGGFE
jgi:hypothetical protein